MLLDFLLSFELLPVLSKLLEKILLIFAFRVGLALCVLCIFELI